MNRVDRVRYPDHMHTSSGEYSSEEEMREPIDSKVRRNSLRGVKNDLTSENINQTFEGETLLHIALKNGYWAIAKYLIEQNANPDIPNCKERTVRQMLTEGAAGDEGCVGLWEDYALGCQELFQKLGE